MSKAIKVATIGLLAVLILTIIIFGSKGQSIDLVVAVNKWRLPESFQNVQARLAPFCHDLVGSDVIHHPNCAASDMAPNKICGLQNEFSGKWDSSFLKTSPELAARNVSSVLKEHGCEQVVIDFEGVTAETELLEAWMKSFLKVLRSDFKLSMAAYAKNQKRVSNELANRQNYSFICSEYDEIWLMTYDYSIPPWTSIGELAPLSWVNEVVDYALTKCSPDQVRVGLAAYGYDWETKKTIAEIDAPKNDTSNPSIEYLYKRREKVKALKEKGIMKYFIWSLGMFDQAL